MASLGRCPRLFGRVGAALRSLRDLLARPLPLADRPLSQAEMMEALQRFETNEVEFIRILARPLDNSAYSRLMWLELAIDTGFFLDTVGGLTREAVDLQISYEFQNVRAYLYYLTVKARVRAYQQTFRLAQLVDRSLFSFRAETIVFHIRENTRFMAALASFLPYCQASVNHEQSNSIFRKRAEVFLELQAECFQLFFFLLVHHDFVSEEALTKEVVSAIKYFRKALGAYDEIMREVSVRLDFKNPAKALSQTFLDPTTALFEHIFLKKNNVLDSEELLGHLRAYLRRFVAMQPASKDLIQMLEAQVEARMDALRGHPLRVRETSPRKTDPKAGGEPTSLQSSRIALPEEGGKWVERSLPVVPGGKELASMMRQPSIVIVEEGQK